MKKEDLYSNLLCVQHALIDSIPINLRAVTLYMDDNESYINFYHHGNISDDDYDQDMAISMYVDLEGVKNGPIERMIRLDRRTIIPKDGYLVYKVHEESFFDFEEDWQEQHDLNYDYFYPENFREDLKEIFGDNIRPLAMLSGQKALLNRVEDNLRSVKLKWSDENIWLYFYYDYEITKKNKLLAKEVVEDFMKSFPEKKLITKISPSADLFIDNIGQMNSSWNYIFYRD